MILQEKEQMFRDEILKKEIESERLMQTVEKDILKQFITAANYGRDDILNLMYEIYPLKSNQEIEGLVEEVYPKSKPQAKQTRPNSG